MPSSNVSNTSRDSLSEKRRRSVAKRTPSVEKGKGGESMSPPKKWPIPMETFLICIVVLVALAGMYWYFSTQITSLEEDVKKLQQKQDCMIDGQDVEYILDQRLQQRQYSSSPPPLGDTGYISA